MALRSLLSRTLIKRSKFTKAASVAVKDEHKQNNNNENGNWKYHKTGVVTALLGSVLVGSSVKDQINNKNKVTSNTLQKIDQSENKENVIIEPGQKRSDLPTYSAEEVGKHDTKNSFWVIYKHGVYDVTEFLPSHPGGEQILNAAGLSIEPFWNVYGMHKTQQVFKLLESYRIGNLHDDDVVDHTDDELWAKEPFRDKRLIVKTAKPFNAEIPPQFQIEHFDTPNELFYVRQHMPVPDLDPANHKLRVTIVDKEVRTKEFTVRDLDKFRRSTVRAALMCAGNRRSEMDKIAVIEMFGKQVKPVKGIDWAGGAVSNAVWSGVLLRDLLLHCGLDYDLDRDHLDHLHVILQGSDTDATGEKFSTSIPLRMALDPGSCVLLATHMNGAPLPPDHGRPLRAVVPGAPAVRSVKWLESITVSKEESPSHWHQKDYRSFNASKTWETADFPSAPPLYSLPVTSAICSPSDGDTVQVKNGHIEVKGYAYSGGGARIVRVDVSADGGRSWTQAHVRTDPAPPHRHYSWALWAVAVPLAEGQREVEIWAKATDSNFNTQPEKFDHIWNIRGLLSNAYHRIKVKLDH